LGNLRTAVVAYLAARHDGLAFRMRIEDLDERCRPGLAQRQLADLAALGIEWDGPVIYQSERQDAYHAAVSQLMSDGLVYECFCSRRDILEAPRAPHRPPGAYPGACRELSAAQRSQRREIKQPALRLRAAVGDYPVWDRLAGSSRQPVDDFILRRADGLTAYNLAVVVDDAVQGVSQVTRGDDLLTSSGRQSYLAALLGLPAVSYVHLPLVYNAAGQRLSKRDAALAGPALFKRYGGPGGLLTAIAGSIGLADGRDSACGGGAKLGGHGAGTGPDGIAHQAGLKMDKLLRRFDWDDLKIGPWTP
jgi:glutamyl-tRNA synthetase